MAQRLKFLARQGRVVRTPERRAERELRESDGPTAGRLVGPEPMAGGHLRAGLELRRVLPQRMGDEEPDQVRSALFREVVDDVPGVGGVGELHLNHATPDPLATGLNPNAHRRPLRHPAFAVHLGVPGPVPQVDPRTPRAAGGFGRELGKLPRVVGMAIAAQDDAELGRRRLDHPDADEDVGRVCRGAADRHGRDCNHPQRCHERHRDLAC